MADYFTNFSVLLPLTKEQQEYAVELTKQIERHKNDDESLPQPFPDCLADQIEDWFFDTEASPEGLWLHSQDGGQDSACVFIQHLLQKFEFAAFVGFEWSHDCSKLRTDAFGGGAAYITAKKIKTMSTSQWLSKNGG